MDLTQDTRIILALIALAGPVGAAIFSRWLPRYALMLGSLVSLIATLILAAGKPELFPIHFAFVIDFYLDTLSVYFMLLVNLVAFFVAWYISQQEKEDNELDAGRSPRQFLALFGIFYFMLLLVPMVDDMFVLWLIIESTTIVSVVLLLFGPPSTTAEAAWKYLYVTIPGLILTFVGTVLVASGLPTDGAMHWSNLVQIARQLDPRIVQLAFVFVLLGYGAKAGLAPLHTWLPDVHGEAPSPVSALLSGVLLKVALFAILRWAVVTNLTLGSKAFTSGLFLAFGLLSLAVATFAILKQNRFKRVLAYHSLEHMGIIAFGLGVGSHLAILGALLHAFNHALTKELMFLTFGKIRQRYKGAVQPSSGTALAATTDVGNVGDAATAEVDEEHIQGALKAMPKSGWILALGGLSLVGSPPLNIFLSELVILWAAMRVAWSERSVVIGAAIVVFVASLILVFGGLIGHLSKILLDIPPFVSKLEKRSQLLPLYSILVLLLIFGLTIPTFGLISFPELLNRSACIVLGGSASCR